MPAAARRVRQLRLRAENAAAVRRVLPGLEDALRTATLPDSGGRLLLVRRLALGSIAADASPASLALALERAVAAARIDCVPAMAPGAAAASAVWFRDALEAHVALARRVLEGPPPNEWFWLLAVPAWSPVLGPEATLAVLAASLASLPEAPVALPAWVVALSARGHGAVLRAVMGPLDEVGRSGVVQEPLVAGPRVATDIADRQRPMSSPSVDEIAALPSIRDAAEVEALPVAFHQPLAGDTEYSAPEPQAESPSPLLAARATLKMAEYDAASRPLEQAFQTQPAPQIVAAVADAKLAPITESPSAKRNTEVSFDSAVMRPASPDAPPPTNTAERTPVAVQPIADEYIDSLPTTAGGIAFVLPVLARLGYPQWLAAHPARADTQIARRVLGQLLTRLRIDHGDPAWALVGRLDQAAGPATSCALPASWSALTLRHDRRPLALDTDAPATDQQLATLWARAVHRWLRRHARIGLADLIRRPALIELTPTHIDVRYDLRHIELRIRRAGLDLDPGWLPWFGRVVGFHYQRLE